MKPFRHFQTGRFFIYSHCPKFAILINRQLAICNRQADSLQLSVSYYLLFIAYCLLDYGKNF